MMAISKSKSQAKRRLRVGCVPLVDAAPLLAARALGLFDEAGLDVRLNRELGWATIRDKILFGELDAAHALATLPFVTSIGLGCVATPCVTGLVLSLQGNAITVARPLARMLFNEEPGATADWKRLSGGRPMVFAVPHLHSTHHHLLRRWLARFGAQAGREVRIVVVPPPQMPLNLRAGNIDGFCAGEPWNTVAVERFGGALVATSADLVPQHPEKVLMVREMFAAAQPEEHAQLLFALRRACEFCQAPENRGQLIDLLAGRDALNLPAPLVEASLAHVDDAGVSLHIFGGEGVTAPTVAKARWLHDTVLTSAVAKPASTPELRRIFRADLHPSMPAPTLPEKSNTHETKPEEQPCPTT